MTCEEYLVFMKSGLDDNMYNTLTEILTDPSFRVVLKKSDETGEKLWVLVACVDNRETNFWMNGDKLKSKMVEFAKNMGWKLRRSDG